MMTTVPPTIDTILQIFDRVAYESADFLLLFEIIPTSNSNTDALLADRSLYIIHSNSFVIHVIYIYIFLSKVHNQIDIHQLCRITEVKHRAPHTKTQLLL